MYVVSWKCKMQIVGNNIEHGKIIQDTTYTFFPSTIVFLFLSWYVIDSKFLSWIDKIFPNFLIGSQIVWM